MITHVAIRYNGQIWSLPSPFRHHHVIRVIHYLNDIDTYSDDEQGFLDHTGTFLSRRQAKYRAIECGQITSTLHNELFSEDLW